MGNIGREVGILEPVMGRRVLPNEHKKFYQAFRLLSFLMSQELKDVKIEGSGFPIALVSLLQVEIPENIKMQ